jgi:hypothetical protein
MRNVTWTRPKFVTLLLKAFRKKRPVLSRPKRPWSVYHTKLTRRYAVSTFWDLACFTGIVLGWGCLLRGSEFATKTNGRLLKLRQLEIRKHEAFITLDHSKTNQLGRKEVISVPCRCFKRTKREFGNVRVKRSFCPCCTLKEYLRIRKRLYPKSMRPNKPLLWKNNDYAVSMQNLRKFMKKAIKCINKHLSIDLDPAMYPTHALRVGGTTDMARSGYSAHMIERAGRWLTDLWKRTYMSNDYRDIALISGLTVDELQQQSRFPV